MKCFKLFVIAVASSFAMLASAAVTSQATIKVSAASGFNKSVDLAEVDNVASDFSNSNNAIYIPSSINDWMLNLWAVGGSNQYGAVVIPDLEGLVIKFKANAHETDYTLSFSNLAGTAYYLQKTGLATLIPMTEDYHFSCALNEEVTFTVALPHIPTYERALKAGQQFGTICYPYAITAVDGAALYEVAGMVDDQLYLDEVVAPFAAGKPYIFKADAAEIAAGKVVFTYDDAASIAAPVAATGLVGTFAATTIAEDGKYVISGNAVRLASAASTVGEYRAYIDLDGVGAPATPAPGVRRVILNLGHVATDIEGLEAAQADGKLLINGQLVIIREGVRYNAQGNVIK